MEKFYLEIPSIDRKVDAFDYIDEFKKYNSDINGVGGLTRYRYYNDYEGWLLKLEEDYVRLLDDDKVPSRTYFLVRENDNRIVGMINIRLKLNDNLKRLGGNIGYSIRPTERGKGYNKINLYLGLKICQEFGLKEVLLDADSRNVASWKTMEALGGKMVREYYESIIYQTDIRNYIIDVDKSIEENKSIYEKYVSFKKENESNWDSFSIR